MNDFIRILIMTNFASLLVFGLAAVSALPTDSILNRPKPGPQFQYVEGSNGVHLTDLRTETSDLQEAARYNPDTQNVYHLFTRLNRQVSQPLLLGAEDLLSQSNYDAQRRTVVILHGWMGSATADVNAVLVPAFLTAEDLNVIALDWSAGMPTNDYIAGIANTVSSGKSVARFINWLNQVKDTTADNFHIVGHDLGGHMAGIAGRNVIGDVAYITGLDPIRANWDTHTEKFRATDGAYTEVIHTDAGQSGFTEPLADVDFYPNGGSNQPGCDDRDCHHDRSFHYMAESLLSGGFTATRCWTFVGATNGNCFLPGRLSMGGLEPKTGRSGVYYLETNASPPFSRG